MEHSPSLSYIQKLQLLKLSETVSIKTYSIYSMKIEEMCLLASSKIDSSTAHHLTNYEDIVWMTSSEIVKMTMCKNVNTYHRLTDSKIFLHASNYDEII